MLLLFMLLLLQETLSRVSPHPNNSQNVLALCGPKHPQQQQQQSIQPAAQQHPGSCCSRAAAAQAHDTDAASKEQVHPGRIRNTHLRDTATSSSVAL
jgi:hypothetical protein